MPQVEHPNSTKGGKQVSRVTKQNFVDSRRAGSFLERWDGRTTTSLLHCLSRQRVACCMPCAMAGNPCDPLWYQEGRSCPHGIHVPWHGIRRLIYIYIYTYTYIYTVYVRYDRRILRRFGEEPFSAGSLSLCAFLNHWQTVVNLDGKAPTLVDTCNRTQQVHFFHI